MGKNIPLRKCIACGEKKGKKELLRIVRAHDGNLFPDRSQKADGRGAYICKEKSCFEKARKKRALSGSFHTQVPDSIWDELEIMLEDNIKE